MILLSSLLLMFITSSALAQDPTAAPARGNAEPLPDAPVSQTGSSSPAAQPRPTQSNRDKAAQQLKLEEKQRILGIAPNFGTSYDWNAPSLTAGQKMELAFRSAVDPFTFAAAGIVAGAHEALDDEPGFGWGATGYGQRAGAAYLDAFDGDLIGNGILPSLLHQDPRFFRRGYGSFRRRLFYAISTSFVCRGDKNRRWEPNLSNIGGNIIAGGISNLYYPSQNSGWGQTIGNGMIVTAEGAVGGAFDEFWPDISRKLFHRDPTRGTDVQPAPPIKPKSH